MDTSNLVFLDTETTNLDHTKGEIWELAFDIDGTEYDFFFRPTNWEGADARSLQIGRFWERTAKLVSPVDVGKRWDDPFKVAAEIAPLLAGRHIVGAVPNFDENFLRWWFIDHQSVLTTHYHLIDIETMAVGYMAGRWAQSMQDPTVGTDPGPFQTALPWKSDDLSRYIGVDPEQFDRHTALGDVRWVKAQYEALVKGLPL